VSIGEIMLSVLLALFGAIINDAGFNANMTTTIKSSVPVVFVDVSTDPPEIDRVWDLGDGSTASGRVVQHIYSSPGTYSVSMKVGDNTYQRNDYIEVIDLAKPEVSVSSNLVKPGQPIDFSLTFPPGSPKVTPTSTTWYFGDGSSSNQANTQHSYETTGTFSLKLLVTYQIDLGGPFPIFRQLDLPLDPITVMTMAVLVDASNQIPDNEQNGISWETAFSDLQRALDHAASHGLPFVCVSDNPIEVQNSKTVSAIRVPSGVRLFGGHSNKQPLADFSSNGRTPISLASPGTKSASMKYMISLESNSGIMGFGVDVINNGVNAIGGIGAENIDGSYVRNVDFRVLREPGVQTSANCITLNNSKRIGLEDLVFGEKTSIGPGSFFLKAVNGISIRLKNCSFENNTLTDVGSGLISFTDCLSSEVASSRFLYNAFGESSAGAIRFLSTGDRDITDGSTIVGCDFKGNSAGVGAAVSIDKTGQGNQTLLISSSSFRDNLASGKRSLGGSVFQNSGDVTVENSVFFGNLAANGNAIFYQGSSLRVTHCTFGNGPASGNTADLHFLGKNARIENSILFSRGDRLVSVSSAAANPVVYSCIVWPVLTIPTLETTVIDPGFKAPDSQDFSLGMKSPAIDRAKHETPYFDYLGTDPSWKLLGGSYDIRGVPRSSISSYDIGAFEWTDKPVSHFLDAESQGKTYPRQLAEIMKKFYADNPDKLPDPKILEIIDASLKAKE
jgi:hypothetical protein